ncbi:MAG: hypothetical protein ACHQ8D_04090 [Candidatus Rokuibacteriota bacterium]
MSRSLGPALPPGLLTRLSQGNLPSLLGLTLPFVTQGEDGAPYPMLCSYLEWLAVDARTLRLAIAAGSRSARNLEDRRVGTLLLIEPERTMYVKCRATGAPRPLGDLARFTLSVEDVLDDRPAEAEGDARIVGGITYRPLPALDAPWARAVLAALRAD